nr:YkvA family protein [Ramlibacter agri]
MRQWARKLKRDGLTLWFALKDRRTPWYAKALAAFVVAYALSPIDLIPDFIPVLGYLDDVILLPVLIWLTLKLVPVGVLDDCRLHADAWLKAGQARPRSTAGAIAISLIWIAALVAIAVAMRGYLLRAW